MPHNRHNGSRKKPRKVAATLQRVAKATRSGLRRYPRAIFDSIRDPTASALRAQAGSNRPLPDLAPHDLAAVWLGHATVLLRYGGKTILADPVFAHRLGLALGPVSFGLPRHSPAPVRETELPPVDLLLISHAHFDHLDRPTLRRLANPDTRVVTARRTSRLIPRGFGDVVELDWDQELRIGDLTLAALRPAHWGARTAVDRRRGYNSYVLRDSRAKGGGVLLAGDTAYTDAFRGLSSLALAVLGIGSYEPWAHAHATPEEAWRMFQDCGAARMLPVHHSTFPLGDEHIDEPMQRLLAAAGPESGRIIQATPGSIWAA